jgi:hypothetical protein
MNGRFRLVIGVDCDKVLQEGRVSEIVNELSARPIGGVVGREVISRVVDGLGES